MVSIILLIVAAVLFAIAAFGADRNVPVHLGWIGAACLAIALAIGGSGAD